MVNLNFYPGDIFQIYDTAVNRKQDAALRLRLTGIAPQIRVCYNNYRHHFTANTLPSVVADEVGSANKADLMSLYLYKSFVIRSVKRGIREAQLNVISDTCQNCTINSVNSMDHVLPISAFPEFGVHPLNLFPCCSECNSKKNDHIVGGGPGRFLNLYLDQLPNEQYLFPVISQDPDGIYVASFTVDNRNGIDRVLFEIINNHYTALDLCRRMRLASVDTVTNVINQIRIRRANLPVAVITQEIIDVARENMMQLGPNHFKHLLEISLVQNAGFMASI